MSGEELRAAAERLVNLHDTGWTTDSEQAAWAGLRAALAAPSTPEPSGDWSRLPTVAQVVVDSWPEEGKVVTRDQVRSLMEGARLDIAIEPSGETPHRRIGVCGHEWTCPPSACTVCRAAPSTEPALDVERLAQALHDQKMDWDDGDSHAIGTLVYDQDGDTHTEWGNCTGPDGHRSVAYDLVDRAARLAESQP